MGEIIVLIHSAAAVFLLLYLVIRLLISLFMLKDGERLKSLRSRFRKADWGFGVLLAVSGLYPLILLGQFELYHILKLLILMLFIWLSRYAKKFNFVGVTVLVLLLVIYAGYSSFNDSPVFPKKAHSFDEKYPESDELSALEKGELIFNTLCIACHGADGKLGRFGAADLTRSVLTQSQKIEIIRNGSPLTVMRSFSKELTEEEILSVAEFVHKLAE